MNKLEAQAQKRIEKQAERAVKIMNAIINSPKAYLTEDQISKAYNAGAAAYRLLSACYQATMRKEQDNGGISEIEKAALRGEI